MPVAPAAGGFFPALNCLNRTPLNAGAATFAIMAPDGGGGAAFEGDVADRTYGNAQTAMRALLSCKKGFVPRGDIPV